MLARAPAVLQGEGLIGTGPLAIDWRVQGVRNEGWVVLGVLERATGVWHGDGSNFESGSDGSLFGQGPLEVGRTSTAFNLICWKKMNENLTWLPHCKPQVSRDYTKWMHKLRKYRQLFLCNSIQTCCCCCIRMSCFSNWSNIWSCIGFRFALFARNCSRSCEYKGKRLSHSANVYII